MYFQYLFSSTTDCHLRLLPILGPNRDIKLCVINIHHPSVLTGAGPAVDHCVPEI